MRVGALDDLAVHFEHQPHDAVRRRVLRPEIQREIADLRRPGEIAAGIAGRRLNRSPAADAAVAHAPVPCGPPVEASPGPGPAFSSPGSILSMPSHGDRKSK